MPQHKIILFIVAASALGVGLALAFVMSYLSGWPQQSKSSTANSEFGDALQTRYYCTSSALESINPGYPIRQPDLSSMPSGYQFQAVSIASNAVGLFYDDQKFCPSSPSDFVHLKGNNAVMVTITPQSGVMNGEKMQEADLKSWQSDKLVGDRVKAVDINGYKGVGWDLIGAVDKDGNPVQLPGGWMQGTLFFYHEADKTMYAIYANEPLDKLIEIARSIAH